ncbi:MAG: D-lyxose/D-mannose family sugar isomerase [Oscillospiraceae bacterium]|jgi:D-lyxose ketol-isomerase|nr:D-lyxose/D-mannose family sugar isomerase [Oscillospiraceae bacterium]
MKRSQINTILREAEAFIGTSGFKLPAWASYTPDIWAAKLASGDYDEVRDLALGWDVTDYGQNDFAKVGLTLFTIRNGSLTNPRYPKGYAEKLLISEAGQVCPCHFHFNKREDIINRSGGTLAMQLWQSTAEGELSEDTFTVSVDGRRVCCTPGLILRLNPGESVTLEPGVYHAFWAEEERVLIGEVSSVNDDENDNRFYVPQARFPMIEEDEAALWLLCNEYR